MRRILFPLILILAPLTSQAVELMKWERIPLPVPLHVNQERIVFVDKNVRVGFPSALTGKLRIQSAAGAVYLLATESFPSTRIQFQDKATGELLLLDISAKTVPENTPVKEPVRLIYSGEVATTTGEKPASGNRAKGMSPAPDSVSETHTQKNDVTNIQETKSRSAAPIPVALTRYAAQRLYALARTVESLPGIRNAAHNLPTRITTLLPGEPLEISPLAAWQLGGYTVMALKVRHTAAGKVAPDPRQLQGQFVSATFQHTWLGTNGTPEDTTTLYLVINGKPDSAFIPEPAACRQVKKTTRQSQNCAGESKP